jgi:hypothetical protein
MANEHLDDTPSLCASIRDVRLTARAIREGWFLGDRAKVQAQRAYLEKIVADPTVKPRLFKFASRALLDLDEFILKAAAAEQSAVETSVKVEQHQLVTERMAELERKLATLDSMRGPQFSAWPG